MLASVVERAQANRGQDFEVTRWFSRVSSRGSLGQLLARHQSNQHGVNEHRRGRNATRSRKKGQGQGSQETLKRAQESDSGCADKPVQSQLVACEEMCERERYGAFLAFCSLS